MHRTVRLSSDDTLFYIIIANENDSQMMQKDLQNLEHWEDEEQMCFHLDKCQVILISRKRNPIKYTYRLHGQALKAVPSVKYLCLTVTHDMKWNNHISNINVAANRTFGFLRRNLRVNSARIKEHAYKTLVRPKLEYCATV